MFVKWRQVENVTIFDIESAISFYDALELNKIVRDKITELQEQDEFLFIVLNLTKVSRIESEGIGTIVGLYASLYNAGGRLALIVPDDNKNVRNSFHVAKLDTIFPIYDTEDKANQSFQKRFKEVGFRVRVPLVPKLVSDVLEEDRAEFEREITIPFNATFKDFQIESEAGSHFCFQFFSDRVSLKSNEVAFGRLFNVHQDVGQGPAAVVRFFADGTAWFLEQISGDEYENIYQEEVFWEQVLAKVIDFIRQECQKLDSIEHYVPKKMRAIGEAFKIVSILLEENEEED